jgi:ferredoxin-NADP reductase
MKVVFDHSKDEAANIRTFFFKPERPVHYTAGQFAEWTIKHSTPDDRGTRRWFTISSSPTDEFVTITTKYAGDDKSSSFKKALFSLEQGDEIQMSEPMGDFVLPKLIQTPLVFVAGGIGITPFHSILSWLADTNEERPIKMIYGVSSEDEIIFQDTFEKAGQHATIIVSDPSDSWGGERGRITPELILSLAQPDEDTLVYVSGPEPMVEALEKGLKKAGLPKAQFVGDFFPNYSSNY